MGRLYAIRGWVEGDSEIVEGVRGLVAKSPFARHWHFSSPAVGQHGFALFGAPVKDGDCAVIEEQVREIASKVQSNFSDIHEHAHGYFEVTCLSGLEKSRRW